MDWSQFGEIAKYAGPFSILTFLLGFFTSRFTLTKKERIDQARESFKISQELSKENDARYQDFASSIKEYIDAPGDGSLDLFTKIAISGDRYFSHTCLVCDAILSGNVDRQTRDNRFIPAITKVYEVSLPKYYSSLRSIAKSNGFDYNGDLDWNNFRGIIAVLEKYNSSTLSH